MTLIGLPQVRPGASVPSTGPISFTELRDTTSDCRKDLTHDNLARRRRLPCR